MRPGVGNHVLEMGARRALAPPLPRGLGLGALQPREQIVADGLEAGDVLDRGGGGASSRLLRRGFGVGGEFALEPRDLPPQRPARALLVGLGDADLFVFEIDRRLAERVGRASRVDRLRELTRFDTQRGRRVGGIRGEALQGGGEARVVGDEGAEALVGNREPFALEAAIDAAGGVDVDARSGGELADPRQPRAGLEAAAPDQGPQAPGELDPDLDLSAALDLGRAPLLGCDHDLLLARHCDSTL